MKEKDKTMDLKTRFIIVMNAILRTVFILIFAFTNISYAVSSERSALRPLALKNSESGPISIGDSRDEGVSDPPEQQEEESPVFSAEEQLDIARGEYEENRLDSIARATEILLDYIYSGDEKIRQKAAAILKTRNNLFVISEEPAEPHKFGRIDYPAGTAPTKTVFENMVRAGIVKPVVIVNIERAYPRIELAYAAEMRRISRYYNGNVTFILRVEESEEFVADLPMVIPVLHATRDIMGDDFDRRLTIQIPDGGFETSLGPVLLRYHKHGLLPYYRETSSLQEVFTRAGRMIAQMPGQGRGYHIICGASIISEPETFNFNRFKHKSLQMAAVKRPWTVLSKKTEEPLLLFAGGKPQGFVGDMTSERIKELQKRATVSINCPYYLAVWNKKSLPLDMISFYSTNMADGRPIAHAPVNIHREFLRSVFFTPEEWMQLYHRSKITTMTVEDWMKTRELAVAVLGEKAEKVEFVTGQARDEGMLERLIARFSKRFRTLNRVKRDPGIMLGNATEAMLDHVIFRGKRGRVIFGGPNVRLSNVIIELKAGETLYIPDGWIIKDSYIGKNTFEEGGGLLIGATLYEDEELHPLRDKIFKSNTCNSVISRLDREPLFISASFDTPTDIITEEGEYKFEELQWQVDAAENRRALSLLQETITQEFEHIPSIFPLSIKAYKKLISRPIEKKMHDLGKEIIGRQKEQGGGQHDVYIEGIQGTDKTFFAKSLAESLTRQGKNVVLLHENWYRKSQEEMKNLRKNKPGEWKRHSASWHRWDKLQKDIERICSTEEGQIELEGIYSRSKGSCDLERTINMTPDTIFIYTGFYTHDIAKFYGQDIKDLSALPSRPSTRIYLALSQEDSLKVKLKRDKKWLSKKKIRSLDKKVYAPAFQKYIATYDPAAYSDYVFRIDIKPSNTINEVKPHTRLWRERRPREENPPAVKNVVIFGAGAIGRGLFAFNFRRSGYKIFFVDTNEKLTRRLRERGGYGVLHLRTLPKHLVKKGAPKEDSHGHYIDKATATLQNEIEEIEKQVFKADAICLTVPDANLSEVCALLGRCLEQRLLRGNLNPINIFLATGRLNANKYVRELILKGVSLQNRIKVGGIMGIVETTVEGITRLGTERERRIGSSRVYGDSFSRFIADEKGFKGLAPDIIGMHLAKDTRTDITREKQKRLFLFESTYSFIAYLGYLRGYTYIHEAWADPWIKNETEKLLRIASEALIKRCGFTSHEQDIYIRDLKDRFANEIFKDPVVRAARDPLRKLDPEERFAGLARLIEDTNIEQEGIIALAITACLRYYNSEDTESKQLQAMIEIQGVESVLRDICEIDPESRLGRLIIEKYQQFEDFGVAYAGLTLVNPKPTEGTTHIVMGFDGVVADTIPIFRKHFAYIYWKIVNDIADDDKRKPKASELLAGKRYFNKILDHHHIGKAIPFIIKLAQDKGINPKRLKSPDEYLAEYLERRDSEINTILKTKAESLLKPGIIEFLTGLQKIKKQVYLLTTTDLDRLKKMVKILGLEEYFTDIIQVERPDDRIKEMKMLMKWEVTKPSYEPIKPSNVIFIDNSSPVLRDVRDKIGEDLHIVAIREEVGKNDRGLLFSDANFILDNFIPSKNKLSIFLKTEGLTVPKKFKFPKQTPTTADPVDIKKHSREQKSIEQINSAA